MTVYGNHRFAAASGHVDPAAGGLPHRHVRGPGTAARHVAGKTPSSPYRTPTPASPAAAGPGMVRASAEVPPASPPTEGSTGQHEGPATAARMDPKATTRQARVAAAKSQWDAYPWADEWLRLAEDLFWVMHRDRDGKLLVHPRIAGLSLAAALLAGMLRTRTLTIRHGLLVADQQVSDDGIAARIVTQVHREPRPHPVRTWVEFLAGSSYEQVARSLVRAGRLRVIRRLLREPRYEPVSMNDAAWARARLSTMVTRRDRPNPFDTALCGFLFATDLHLSVLADGDADTVQQVHGWVAETTPDDVRAVLNALHAAVGSAVVTAT